jgi:nucleoside-diphosphate-sugar epimerase
VLQSNIIRANNWFEAARQSGIEKVVFASTNLVLGMYEEERAPALYEPKHYLLLDEDESVRPDSNYASSKVFGDALGQ